MKFLYNIIKKHLEEDIQSRVDKIVNERLNRLVNIKGTIPEVTKERNSYSVINEPIIRDSTKEELHKYMSAIVKSVSLTVKYYKYSEFNQEAEFTPSINALSAAKEFRDNIPDDLKELKTVYITVEVQSKSTNEEARDYIYFVINKRHDRRVTIKIMDAIIEELSKYAENFI